MAVGVRKQSNATLPERILGLCHANWQLVPSALSENLDLLLGLLSVGDILSSIDLRSNLGNLVLD